MTTSLHCLCSSVWKKTASIGGDESEVGENPSRDHGTPRSQGWLAAANSLLYNVPEVLGDYLRCYVSFI